MNSLADNFRDRIASGGPMTLAEYMNDALTHPRLGYYMQGDTFGRGGDFITAPEISQMFGELIGLWCAIGWQAMGAPNPASLVELGPGRGTLMADMLRAGRQLEGFLDALSVYLVEVSPALKSLQEETLTSKADIHAARALGWVSGLDDVPEGPLLVVANEFFDALPVHQFQKTPDGWRERMIDVENGEFVFALGDDPDTDPILPPGTENAADGDIVEVRPLARTMGRDLGARLMAAPGMVLIIDYGHAESAPGDTLQAVKAHEFHNPLVDPGTADLTAHVDFAEIGRAAAGLGARVYGPVGQGGFLQSLGIKERAEALMAASPSHASDIEAALVRLTSADGMGQLFKVMALASPGLPPPPGFE
ncbi:MAG: SAM-dependent methyltransferase [Proteobacteria bacterium]|nr:SAM-dependent methyltransferase [Pseudomonadota bacterium]MDA1023439.1 SAM-dependent methyltransferase [Pseudomonadota bacterium]